MAGPLRCASPSPPFHSSAAVQTTEPRRTWRKSSHTLVIPRRYCLIPPWLYCTVHQVRTDTHGGVDIYGQCGVCTCTCTHIVHEYTGARADQYNAKKPSSLLSNRQKSSSWLFRIPMRKSLTFVRILFLGFFACSEKGFLFVLGFFWLFRAQRKRHSFCSGFFFFGFSSSSCGKAFLFVQIFFLGSSPSFFQNPFV